jgi:NADPH2:quinone reductase
MPVIYGALGGRAQNDLQPTLRHDLVEERRAGIRALIDMLAAGKLHSRIYRRLPLAEAKLAHAMLESGAVLGKLLLIP